VVTLWPASVAEKRDPVIEIAVLAASASLADVTQGVTWQGEAPAMKTENELVALLPLIATTATVPSEGFW
jgi:hypothetical protein